ncbi:hypothetical protein GCM10023196_036500 [Actinoallomurus vinaceus]|uniref:Uncharacterized protein n=1 Tax=Actinoallomurus vinaceus TaxID=1080074 RepID=A0ABP8UBU7_9ACTN
MGSKADAAITTLSSRDLSKLDTQEERSGMTRKIALAIATGTAALGLTACGHTRHTVVHHHITHHHVVHHVVVHHHHR